MKDKKIRKKDFEPGTWSSCVINAEKLMKNKTKQRKKEGRKRIKGWED